MLIRATYTDHKGGTGIKPSACRLYVDDKNRSRSANIGKYGLHLQLKNVPNGDHTYEIQLRDHAGNTKVVKRTFSHRRAHTGPDAFADHAADVQSGPHLSRRRTPRRRPSRSHADADAHHHADAV